MPRLIFKNNFEVALAQPTTTSDTTITIRSGSGFPTLGANERVVATIVDAATGLQFEIVTVTAVVGNVLTVQRAQEGTAARAWAAGDMLSIRTTAATLTNTERNFGAIPSGINLNALTGSWFGKYFQEGNANASPSLNYPVQKAGVLEVLQTGVLTESCVQRYSVWDNGIIYARAYSAESQTWYQWRKIYTDKDVIPIANGGTGQTTIQGMKDAFGFGPVADQSVVPTSMGGTGSANNAQAWLNIRPQGSTPLAGDPVNDYDAATKRWVENLVNTGTVGPNMNGVMNYGVGDFHLRDSRAYIQPYEVVADGQLLNRADWPELWAYAQMLSPIADADWLADPLKRGKYSLGNGTTTFRVPDKNGVQTGSIQALFGRGDGGNSGDDGMIFAAAAPNIIGEIPSFYGFQAAAYDNASGALAMNGKSESTPMNQWNSSHPGVSASFDINFRASRSSPVYGRNSITDNILPRNFVGVWVIRASGGFVAANTSWSVINGDGTAPPTGTAIKGGEVRSDYTIGNAMHLRTSLRADGNYAQRGSGVWRVEDSNGVSAEITFTLGGAVVFPLPVVTDGMNVISRSIQNSDGTWPVVSPLVGCQLTNRVANPGFAGAQFNMYIQENVGVDAFGGLLFQGANTSQAWLFNQFGNAIAPGSWVSNSDRRIKKDIVRVEDPLGKMRKLHGYTWRRLDSGQFGIGYIAQEVQELFPESVYVGPDRTLPDGTVVKGVLSPDSSGVSTALHHEAILALMDQIDELKAEIAALKAAK